MANVVNQCPVLMFSEFQVKSAVEILDNQLPDDFGAFAQQLLKRPVKCIKVVWNVLTSDLIVSLDTLVDRGSHDFTRSQQAEVNSVKQRSFERIKPHRKDGVGRSILCVSIERGLVSVKIESL